MKNKIEKQCLEAKKLEKTTIEREKSTRKMLT